MPVLKVDPSKVSLTELALTKLPDTLILDDIERCDLKHRQLSGLINYYVQHKKKRIILIANSEKHSDKDAFDATREKLIGQTITLRPETEAAIAAVWAKIPEGQGRQVPQDRQHLILKTFADAKHQNLRLLMRAMRDAAEMLNALSKEMLEFTEPVDRLTTTFLALHMAYHGGEIGKTDMANRWRYEMLFMSSAGDQDVKSREKLKLLVDRHAECDIAARNRCVLQSDLAQMLIVDGYADAETIRKSLDQTQQFKAAADRPDWIRLWNWYEEGVEELEKLLKRIDRRFETMEITNPGEILQIHAAHLWLDRFSGAPAPKAIARKTYDYILRLAEVGKVRAREPSARDRRSYGFSLETGKISFGGYAFEPSKRDMVIAGRLMREMDKAYDASLSETASTLLELLEKAPKEFLEHLRYSPQQVTFDATPILHHFPASDAATYLLRHFEGNRSLAIEIAQVFGRRRGQDGQVLADEQKWFLDLEDQLVQQAAGRSPLLAAQIRLFISRDLRAR